jgi:hypothetical protein
MAIQYFLLVYDRAHRHLQTVQTFTDKDDASSAYTAVERAVQGNTNLEIVLIGSDSIETIMQTHGQYFDPPDGGSRFLRPVAAG